MSAVRPARTLLRNIYRSISYVTYYKPNTIVSSHIRCSSTKPKGKAEIATDGILAASIPDAKQEVESKTLKAENDVKQKVSHSPIKDLAMNGNNSMNYKETYIIKIKKSETLEEILSVTEVCRYPVVLISAISRIATIYRQSSEEQRSHIYSLLQNKREGQKIVEHLQKDLRGLKPHNLNELILALDYMPKGLFNFDYGVISEAIKARMTLLPIYIVINFLKICRKNNGPDWSKKGEMTEFGKSILSARQHEIVTASHIIEAMRLLDKSSTAFQYIQEQAAHSVHHMNAGQLIQLLETLGNKQVRNIALIRSIIFHLQSAIGKKEIGISAYSKLLYSLAKLTFIDENIMRQISQDLERYLKALEEPIETHWIAISSIVHSFVILRWLSREVMDLILADLDKLSEQMPPAKLIQMVYSIAQLYHWPTRHKQKIIGAVGKLESSSTSLAPGQWVDLVWSLCVLDIAKPQHLSSVLEKDFVQHLSKDSSLPQKVKLQNIDCEARLAQKNYNGQLLEGQVCETLSRNQSKQSLINTVTATLKEMDVFFNTGISLPEGHNIDAEVFLDKDGNLATKNEFDSSGDLQKVALQVLSFYDVSTPALSELGYIKLMRRHIQLKGYRVVMVPYYAWAQKKNFQDQAKYLRHLCKEHV